MTLRNAFADLALDASVQQTNTLLNSSPVVTPRNTTTKFRETFETYTPGTTWTQVTGSNDIIQLDGNTSGASYLVISKDPLSTNTESSVTTIASFDAPIELVSGHSMSQRVLGQEVSVELISTDAALSSIADISIASISQTTTTLTITTSVAHGLAAGQRIGIYGITSDSRLNYSSLVIAAVVSTTSFTATAGPAGTITSLTVGPYSNQGYVYARSAMGYAQEGISQVFENATTTQASIYVRSYAGDPLASGTIAGNHSVTVGTTTSIAAVAGAYAYAFQPTTEYRFLLTPDRVQAYDTTVDSIGTMNNRITRSQIVPNNTKTYKLRYRVTNNKGLTVPTAKIVSAAKAGTTTATITTATAHGLTTGDYVYITGIRNGTDFLPITTAVAVASTPTTTTFTLVYGGTSATVTSYGGLVARAQGNNLPSGFAGAGPSAAVQTAAVTATELTLTSTGTFALAAGDYVNVYGVRDNSTGADLSVDGVYKVANIATTTATLIPIAGTVLPTAFTSTTCGGAVIKRTDLRISFVRAFNFQRERVEIMSKTATDQQGSMSVYMTGGTIGSGTISTVSTASLAINTLVADAASGAITTTASGTTLTPASGTLSQEFNVIVTAVSGTTPTLDYVVQESDDSGTSWYDVYHFPRITAAGQYRSPLIPFTGNRVRLNPTITGTSPSFTRSLNRLQSHSSVPLQRQFFDRVLVPNTANSTTNSYFTEGCKDLSVFVSMGAVTTTAPVLVVEISPDNTNWVQIGADITTTASTNNLLQLSNAQARFTRLRVKTVGVGATLNFIAIKGMS